MAGPINSEIRAALGDVKRMGAVVTPAGPKGQSLKVLIGAASAAKGPEAPGFAIAPVAGSQGWPASSESPGAAAAHLTRRELQVLQLIAKGLHNRQIAARIHRSIKTVEKHRQNLHTKLSTHEVAGLTRCALSLGLMNKAVKRAAGVGKRARQLTPRELEILKLVAQGSGNKWIASELHRSIKTVDHHRENIMKKLNIHEVAGLTRYAVFLGLM